MIVFIKFLKVKKYILILIMLILCVYGICFWYQNTIATNTSITDPTDNLNLELQSAVQQIFDTRDKAILEDEIDILNSLYYQEVRTGVWAYEHELAKLKYINDWINKQSAKFSLIESKAFLRKTQEEDDGYLVNVSVTTEYVYQYNDSTEIKNAFRICTYHSIELIPTENSWMITNEWYKNPFDSILDIDKMDVQKINKIILSGEVKDLSKLSDRRLGALEYADKYCGVAMPPDYNFQYNNEYKNYNSLGGNCANFASQMLYEGGGFGKTNTWNYSGGAGSKAWVNANAFNNYMIYSGRASLIEKGTYEQVLKNSYKLLPGDYIAYEKKGKVAHISVVTGIDSKGYALVNCHNSDRYRVPWDLGWSGDGIKFWLVRVHY